MCLPKESDGRLRFLDDDEIDALLAAVPEPLPTIINKPEALQLQTTDVDLARGLLTVQAAYAKQQLGGWRSLKMVERYPHRSPSHKAGAVERIAGRLSAKFPNAIPKLADAHHRRRAASALQ